MRIDSMSDGGLEFKLTTELTLGDVWTAFIEELKSAIPKEYRSYDPASNVWTIRKPAVAVFFGLRKKYFIGENQEDLFGEE